MKSDGMGFSLHDTIIKEGTEQRLYYKHHLEANYCISGRGEVLDVKTGRSYHIGSGTLYALDQHDEHILRAVSGDLHLICVFNPALAGPEKHQPDGSYEAAGAIEPEARRLIRARNEVHPSVLCDGR